MAIVTSRLTPKLAVLLAAASLACGGTTPGPGPGGDPGGTPGPGPGGGAGGTPAPALQAIVIGTGHAYAEVGVAQRLEAIGHYSDGTTAVLTSGVTWASTDASVASVDVTGLVTPWARGTACITATHAATGLSASADLTSRLVVPVAAGAPLPGAVDTTEAFFHVTGLTPGAMYRPTVKDMTDDVDLAVYSDHSMQAEALLCQSDDIGTTPDECVAPANANGELWIAIDGEWTHAGAQFTLAFPPAESLPVAGTLAYPAAFPYPGCVGNGKRLFEVTGLAPGGSYEVRISNLTADVDLWVYGDTYEYGLLCSSYQNGTVDDLCTARASAAGSFFVELDGETTTSGGTYTLTLTPK